MRVPNFVSLFARLPEIKNYQTHVRHRRRPITFLCDNDSERTIPIRRLNLAGVGSSDGRDFFKPTAMRKAWGQNDRSSHRDYHGSGKIAEMRLGRQYRSPYHTPVRSLPESQLTINVSRCQDRLYLTIPRDMSGLKSPKR
jgi:hypothetical protein